MYDAMIMDGEADGPTTEDLNSPRTSVSEAAELHPPFLKDPTLLYQMLPESLHDYK